MEPEQVRNIMDSMIRKLYDMELEEQGRSDWQNGALQKREKISERTFFAGYFQNMM